ncbi:unnamed protein product, partial [marine sediment metagenome]
DAAIKANMDSMRLAAEIYYTDNLTYTTATTTDGYVQAKAAADAVDPDVTWTESFNADAYCIARALPGGGVWCVDSVGAVEFATTTGCVADNYTCAVD